MKSNSDYRAARRPKMILIAKARRKAARIHDIATRKAPKPWVWQRATPRAS